MYSNISLKLTRLLPKAFLITSFCAKREVYLTPKEPKAPSFLALQRTSFEHFLNVGFHDEWTYYAHMQPQNKERWRLEWKFCHKLYCLKSPRRSIKQCILKRSTYSVELFMPVKIMDHKTGQFFFHWFLFVDLPWMTQNGHFIINGSPRIVLSQVIRSPGVYFQKVQKSYNKTVYYGDFIAKRGSWLRLSVDEKQREIFVKLKNTPKLAIVPFLLCFGLKPSILNQHLDLLQNPRHADLDVLNYSQQTVTDLMLDPVEHLAEDVYEAHRFADPWVGSTGPEEWPARKYYWRLVYLFFLERKFWHRKTYSLGILGRHKLNQKLGLCIDPKETCLTAMDVLFGCFYLLECANGNQTVSDIDDLQNRTVKPVGELLQNQFALGLFAFEKQLVQTVYGPPKRQNTFFKNAFRFVPERRFVFATNDAIERWDLTCANLNQMYNNLHALRSFRKAKRKNVFDYKKGKLTFKPLRQYQRSESQILGRMFGSVLNPKTLNRVLRQFFGTNPLSQFLDETNSLAEITHKRRLSSLGIGGVQRETATMDIRGIHPTHYGRICPIETPEGQNAGLVNSFTTYAQLNSHYRISTPFYSSYKGWVCKEKSPFLLSSDQELSWKIAPGDILANVFHFLPKNVTLPARQHRDFKKLKRADIDFIGLHPVQMISIATSLIPFLEHNDGNRALMGSNMQRQAVATLQPTRPMVTTGFEGKTVADVGANLRASQAGLVSYVDGRKIIVQQLTTRFLKKRTPYDAYKFDKQRFKSAFYKADLSSKKTFWSQGLSVHQKGVKTLFNWQLFDINVPSRVVHKVQHNYLWTTSFYSLVETMHYSLNVFSEIGDERSFVGSKHKFGSTFFKARAALINNAYFTLKMDANVKSTKMFFSKNQTLKEDFYTRTAFSFQEPSRFCSILSAWVTKPTQITSSFLNHPFSRGVYSLFINRFLGSSHGYTQRLQVQTFFMHRYGLSTWMNGSKMDSKTPFTFSTPSSSSCLTKVGLTYSSYTLEKRKGLKHGLVKVQTPNVLKRKFFYTMLAPEKNVSSFQNLLYATPFIKHINTNNQKKGNDLFSKNLKKDGKKKIVNIKKTVSQKPMLYLPLKPSSLSFLTEKKTSSNGLNFTLKTEEQTSKTRRSCLAFVSEKYCLDAFWRSNQDTHRVHRPRVQTGQWVEKGDLLADNSSSSHGELAVGQNLWVGYTPMEGYNFEDAILINQRMVSEDVLTSLHVERYEVNVRDTRFGPERVTKHQLPGRYVDPSWKFLDYNGVIKVGSWVEPGDLLVGKITPLAEKWMFGYERLLWALVKRNPQRVRETSVCVPPGVSGRVIHVEVMYYDENKLIRQRIQGRMKYEFHETPEYAAKEATKQTLKQHAKKEINQETKLKKTLQLMALRKNNQEVQASTFKMEQNRSTLEQITEKFPKLEQKTILNRLFQKRPSNLQVVPTPTLLKTWKQEELQILQKQWGLQRTPEQIKKQVNTLILTRLQVRAARYKTQKQKEKTRFYFGSYDLSTSWVLSKNQRFNNICRRQLLTLHKASSRVTPWTQIVSSTSRVHNPIKKPRKPKTKAPLIRRVYVYIGEKRKVQVGDKLSGRHGNKGIISRILPAEDMPYLPDGTPLDVVLNPLGVPSRMNVGQIFECLLGLAGSYLNQSYKIQPFDEIYGHEASRSFVYSKLYEARLKTKQNWLFDPNFPGKVRLFDGRTGQCFEQPITVGRAYILKLIHLVDEKMHARSTGPYSLVTQQPLRGRSKKGGQRVGEMEVWALEGFGAAYILYELLTFKSDDIFGRQEAQESMTHGKPFVFGTPESFKVLIRELQALCLDMLIYQWDPIDGSINVDLFADDWIYDFAGLEIK